MQDFLDKFEEYCKTPGIESGKAHSYSKAIEYLCEFLKITSINNQTVQLIRDLESDINDKNSILYSEFLLFLVGRRQKSYLEKGYVKAALKYFFELF